MENKINSIDRLPLSQIPDEDRFVVMLSNQGTAYVSWSISPNRKRLTEQFFQKPWETMTKCLQGYVWNKKDSDIQEGPNQVHERQLNEAEVACTIPVDQDCIYVFDFGVKTERNSFFTLLRSDIFSVSGRKDKSETISIQAFPDVIAVPDWEHRFTGYSLVERGR